MVCEVGVVGLYIFRQKNGQNGWLESILHYKRVLKRVRFLMSARFADLQFGLPPWVARSLPPSTHVYRDDEEKMRLVVALATENVQRQTGGPFGAAVFDRDSGRLIAPGVNIVVPSHWSGGHAEMVALALAQQQRQTHDLGGSNEPFCELFTSVEPCTMCLGAVLWAGVRRLVCGARDEDARSVGFDEGPKPQNWVAELRQRGVDVERDLMRNEAAAVLRGYASGEQPIYNARQRR